MFVTGKSVKCTYTSFTEMVTMEIYIHNNFITKKSMSMISLTSSSNFKCYVVDGSGMER